jgi:hypothetical protein
MKALWEEYDGNLRDIESFLYHVFQNLEKQGEIGADQLYAAFKASPPGEARG